MLVYGDHDSSPSSAVVPQVSLELTLDWSCQKKSQPEVRMQADDWWGLFLKLCCLSALPWSSKMQRDWVSWEWRQGGDHSGCKALLTWLLRIWEMPYSGLLSVPLSLLLLFTRKYQSLGLLLIRLETYLQTLPLIGCPLKPTKYVIISALILIREH